MVSLITFFCLLFSSFSCASECATRRKLQRLANATGRVFPFPHLEIFPPAFLRSTCKCSIDYCPKQYSPYRTPCSIKLVNNTDRDCYARVMAQFDAEIKLFQARKFSQRHSFMHRRKCPCGTECDERQFLSRVNFSLVITFIL